MKRSHPQLLLTCLIFCVTFISNGSSRNAWAHGFRPEVVSITLSRTAPGAVHALTNNQGIFANLSGTYRWICEDAVYPFAKTQGLVLYGDDDERWLVATNHGLHLSVDGGCDFEAVDHELGELRLGGLWRHPTERLLVTVSNEPGVSNRVFLSVDAGEAWSILEVQIEGVFRAFHWLATPEPSFIVHTDTTIYRNLPGTTGFEQLTVQTEQLEIPSDQVLRLGVSPTDPSRILALTVAGERTRALLTTDGGSTWRDVALFTEPDVSILFDQSGEAAIAVGAFGARWRSQDSGETWAPDGEGPIVLRCLTRGTDGEIYGCSNPGADGPWVLGRSVDFGRTWMPVLSHFEDATHRKDCANDGRTFMCCRGRCPGDDLMCGQPVSVEWPAECYEGVPPELFPDAGGGQPVRLDSGAASAVDAQLLDARIALSDAGTEGGRAADATVRASGSDGGCSAAPRATSRPWVLILSLALGVVLRRRRILLSRS